MIRIAVHAVAIVMLLAWTGGAMALPLDRSLGQLKHTRWTTDDGAPGIVRSLAQSKDGFLWIASSTGLYRFDGHLFEKIPIVGAETSVKTVMAARNGDVWMGLQNGHVIRQRGGLQIDLTPNDHGKRIREIIEDKDGGVWVAASALDRPLARFSKDSWTSYGIDQGVPSSTILSLLASTDGAVWILTAKEVRVLRPGTTRFELALPVADSVKAIFADRAGDIWTADSRSGMKRISPGQTDIEFSPPSIVTPSPLPPELRHLLIDRDGGLWGVISSHGLFRSLPVSSKSSAASRVEIFTEKEGLSSDLAGAVLEDREGDIWVGTSKGLDRFRVANAVLETAIPQQSAGGFVLFSDHRGTLYIADNDTLYRALPGQAATPILDHITNPGALCETSDGDVWLASYTNLYRVHGDLGRAEKVAPTPAATNMLRCQGEANDHLLFLTTDGRFFHFDGRQWMLESAQTERSDKPPTSFTIDPQGRRVVFYENKGVVRFDGAKMTTLWPADKIPGGRISPPYSGPTGILIGAVGGLARLRRDRVDLLGPDYGWLRHVTGIVQSKTGDTWLQSTAGIAQIRTDVLNAAFDQPQQNVQPRLFDVKDGLPGDNLIDYGDDLAAIGRDGRVWFATTNGIVWIDPARLERNVLPPPVVITRAVVDGRRQENSAVIKLPAGSKSLEIDYTALSLSVPERVKFKYKLVGIDDRWIDAGDRRQAFYSRLPPGSYRFKVIASNNDGVWNDVGAELPVELPPTFLQSWAFKALGVALAVFALWILYRLRLSVITSRVRARLEGRLRERERIARELHDTLLQGVFGLILCFQAVAEQIADRPLPFKLMGQALDRAEGLLDEGRNRVHGLRSEPLSDKLVDLLQATADAAELNSSTIVVKATGPERAVEPAVRDELSLIVREALTNIARHAEAAAVEITVGFGWKRLVVSVQDNGKGFVKGGSNLGMHFGLIGMRERAMRVGGTLDIQSGPPMQGTTVVATIPARAAYGSGFLRHWFNLIGVSPVEPSTAL